jgi:hypothetical protein
VFTSITPVIHTGVVFPPWQLTAEQVPSALPTAVPLSALYTLKNSTFTTPL